MLGIITQHQACLWVGFFLFVIAGLCGFSAKHKDKVIPVIAFAWAAVVLSFIVTGDFIR